MSGNADFEANFDLFRNEECRFILRCRLCKFDLSPLSTDSHYLSPSACKGKPMNSENPHLSCTNAVSTETTNTGDDCWDFHFRSIKKDGKYRVECDKCKVSFPLSSISSAPLHWTECNVKLPIAPSILPEASAVACIPAARKSNANVELILRDHFKLVYLCMHCNKTVERENDLLWDHLIMCDMENPNSELQGDLLKLVSLCVQCETPVLASNDSVCRHLGVCNKEKSGTELQFDLLTELAECLRTSHAPGDF